MIVEILRSAVGFGIIAPSENTSIWDVWWKQVAEPVDIICCPSLLAMSVESMDSHDTADGPVSECLKQLQAEFTHSSTASMPSARILSPYGKVSWFDSIETVASAKDTFATIINLCFYPFGFKRIDHRGLSSICDVLCKTIFWSSNVFFFRTNCFGLVGIQSAFRSASPHPCS